MIPEHQREVIQEHAELTKRVHSLNKFLMDNHNKLVPQELFTLQIQLDVMAIYMNILRHRIDGFPKEVVK